MHALDGAGTAGEGWRRGQWSGAWALGVEVAEIHRVEEEGGDDGGGR